MHRIKSLRLFSILLITTDIKKRRFCCALRRLKAGEITDTSKAEEEAKKIFSELAKRIRAANADKDQDRRVITRYHVADIVVCYMW